ncbi:hypothetical protein BJ944DRAFT_250715 [Cunninghamella echinulata]|nr:hypothetical protein BJ944DRAFT_250715 [Cunninghamella echinulata]
MDSLPKEIIHIIYSHLPQKSLARCALLCKSLYQATRVPKLYYSIKIVNYQQLIAFLQMATTTKINDIFVGNFVRYLYLEDLFTMQSEIPISDVFDLHEACPNLQYIDTLSTDLKEARNGFPCWQKLTHMNSWVTIYDKSWYLHRQQQSQPQQQPNEVINPIINLDLYLASYEDKIIEIKYKEQFSFYNKSSNNLGSSSFLSFTSNWNNLTSLTLILGYLASFERCIINDHTFESIHQTCPSLKELTMDDLELFISDDYLCFHQLVTSCNTLTLLRLRRCTIMNSEILDYFLIKYPRLTTLDFRLEMNDDDIPDGFGSSFFNLISNLYHLKHLIIIYFDSLRCTSYIDHFQPSDYFFPHAEFRQWYLNSPHQLQTLRYPYPLSLPLQLDNNEQISGNTDKNNDSPILYLDQERTLIDDLFFKNENKSKAASMLTFLIVDGRREQRAFYPISNYLNIFSNLKRLELFYDYLYDFKLENNQVILPLAIYPLEELEIYNCHIHLNAELSTLFKRCPRLKVIHWKQVFFSINYENFSFRFLDMNRGTLEILVDFKHLDLEKVYMETITINEKKAKIIINEVRQNDIKSTITSPLNEYESILHLDCRSVNLIQLKS